MRVKPSSLKSCAEDIMSFTRHEAPITWIITLPMIIGKWPKVTTKMIDFLVVDFGRPSQSQIGITPYVRHQLIKFPTDHDIGTVCGDQPTSKNCYYFRVENKGSASTPSTSDYIFEEEWVQEWNFSRKAMKSPREDSWHCSFLHASYNYQWSLYFLLMMSKNLNYLKTWTPNESKQHEAK